MGTPEMASQMEFFNLPNRSRASPAAMMNGEKGQGSEHSDNTWPQPGFTEPPEIGTQSSPPPGKP